MKISFSISVYEYAAALVGLSPWEASRDEDLLVRSHREAYRRYRHFPVVVGIDIYNIEAEAYGCRVTEPGGTGIPAITEPYCESADEVLRLPPLDPERDGRIHMHIRAGERILREFPDARVCIPLSGPFSILMNLLGVDSAIMACVLDPETVIAALRHLLAGQLRIARHARDRGVDVAFFESGAAPPLLSPALFRDVVSAPLTEIMRGVADIVGHSVPCIIGGDTAPIVPDIMATGTDFVICPAETDRRDFLARMAAYPEAKVRVNLPAEVYLKGTPERIIAEIDAVIELAAGNPNILLGTGALPYETPEENLRLMLDYVAE